MKKYFAPLEGITRYIFRNAYEKYYGGIDKYFAPFMSPADNCAMNPKEKRDVLPENNTGINLVPQILVSKSKHFIAAAELLMDMGYNELNLNFGCPSRTVTSKRKGSGFLTELDDMDRFLEEVYEYAGKKKLNVSIKTRIGRYCEDEWEDILEIYNRYPIYELIIHPRVGEDFYKNKPRMEQFVMAYENSKNPVIYNGDLFCAEDISRIEKDFNVEGVMLGRGLISNPELLEQYESGTDMQLNLDRFRKYHRELYEAYKQIISPDLHVLYKMKELWTYWKDLFEDQKQYKKIMKAKKFAEYDAAVRPLGL